MTIPRTRVTIDGNEAAAYVAHQTNEVIAIYPLRLPPTWGVGDQWSSEQRTNIWGTVPTVVEMQSEGGAAGATSRAPCRRAPYPRRLLRRKACC